MSSRYSFKKLYIFGKKKIDVGLYGKNRYMNRPAIFLYFRHFIYDPGNTVDVN